MDAQDNQYETLSGPKEIALLLNALTESGGVLLCPDEPEARPEPIVLMEQHPGQTLVMDLSSVDHWLSRLQDGEGFYLRGQVQGKVVRTPVLMLTEVRRVGGRYVCCSDYPASLGVLQRRESFRAELRMGMGVAVTLFGQDDEAVQGELRDLSQDGCQLELPLMASGILTEAQGYPLKLALTFPDGTHFVVQGTVRHQKADPEQQLLCAGLRFEQCGADQERQIWYFVCEIEREAARYNKEAQDERQPSPLFESPQKRQAGSHVGRRQFIHYATPAARRLAKVAAFLDAQMLLLQNGSNVDSRQLSHYADRLLLLHEEDRDALLFATRCMTREPLLVRHSLAVAVQLLDLTGANMPRDARKAIAASGMVHDLGKALVPQMLFQAAAFDAPHRQTLQEHVPLLLERLRSCHWLSTNIAQAVIGGINERMDGSGYPQRLVGEQLAELARASAVVDVAEAMRRDRADRPAHTVQQVYRHLLRHPQQFDPRWIKRYVAHFKTLPVGSLVRFSSDTLAWVLRVDQHGNPTEVQIAAGAEPPTSENLGELVRSNIVERLGQPVGEVAVSA
jgi:HD-GYP domain-containing protein (c-di-GMP phosphodiesterase class II)